MDNNFKLLMITSFVWLINFCEARPQEHPAAVAAQSHVDGATPVPIVSFTESVGENGAFNYSYETGNGIKVSEAGILKHVTGLRARSEDPNQPDEEDILVRTGAFSYTAPDGQVINLTYTADENGFQPVGEHIPTAPPIPADIQRALAQIPQGEGQPQQPLQQPQNKQQNLQPQGAQ